MTVPEYTKDEILEKNILIAIRNCGNIDLDGGGGGTINMEDDAVPNVEGPVQEEQALNHEADERYLKTFSYDNYEGIDRENFKPDDIMSDFEDEEDGEELIDYSINFQI